MFTLEAHEFPMVWDEALDRFDELAEDNHHFEMYWFPHTDRVLAKENNRTLDDPASRCGRVPALARRRLPLQHRLRAGQPGRQRSARG